MTGKKNMKREETTAGSTRSFKDNSEKQLTRTNRASKKSSSGLKSQTEKALQERIKELNCFFGISAVMELPNIELDEILQKSFCSSHRPCSFQRLLKPVLYWKKSPFKQNTSKKPPGC